MEVKISAVIITFNEEKNIERCILSLQGIADEILVVDSYSNDATKDICEKYNVRFLEHKFDGHIEQKNWAKDQAVNDFILSLDADEALDKDLQESILKVKANWLSDSHKMNRLTNYCGKWIYHSGWYPDVKTRLFDRRKGNWGGSNPHDKYIPEKGTTPVHLYGNILHYSFYTRAEHIKQINYFSSIASQALYDKGKRSSYLLLVIKPLARFIKAYLVNRGYQDGLAGFTIARLSAYSNYLKYTKLLNIQRGNK